MTAHRAWMGAFGAVLVTLFATALPAAARPNSAAEEAAEIALGALPEESPEAPRASERAAERAADVSMDTPEASREESPREPVATGPKRIVVADFDSPEKEWARPAVLGVFSTQSDVEVVGYQDVVIVARRLGADPMTSAGRRTIAAEMRIFAWIDGTVGRDGQARLWMTGASGESLAVLEARAANPVSLDHAIEAKLWPAFGPFLSESERKRQALEAQKLRAAEKAEARESERERQREVARVRAEHAAGRLVVLKRLGSERAKAREAELAHQRHVVAERRAEEARAAREADLARERQLAEARRREQLAAEQAQAATVAQSPAPTYAAASYARPTYGAYTQPAYAQPTYAQPAYAQPTYAQPVYAEPAYGAYARPAPQAAPAPTPPATAQGYNPFGDNMSPEFRAWAAQRKAEIEATRTQGGAP